MELGSQIPVTSVIQLQVMKLRQVQVSPYNIIIKYMNTNFY